MVMSQEAKGLPVFEKIVKVSCDLFMQVHTVVSCHVVTAVGVGEKVYLCAGIGTRTCKRKGVLWHAYGVVVAEDDFQSTLEVACFEA